MSSGRGSFGLARVAMACVVAVVFATAVLPAVADGGYCASEIRLGSRTQRGRALDTSLDDVCTDAEGSLPAIRPAATHLRVIVAWEAERGWLTFSGTQTPLNFHPTTVGTWASSWIAIDPLQTLSPGTATVGACRRDARGLEHCTMRQFTTVTGG